MSEEYAARTGPHVFIVATRPNRATDETTIAEVFDELDDGTLTADAHLIAAAPDLLTALSDLVDIYERVGGPLAVDPAVAKARAVLARAEGR